MLGKFFEVLIVFGLALALARFSDGEIWMGLVDVGIVLLNVFNWRFWYGRHNGY